MKNLKKWVLDVPFEWRAALSQQGARWNGDVRESVYTGSVLPDHLKPFRMHPFSLGWHNQNLLNDTVIDPPQRLSPHFEPRSHQEEAIAKIEAAFKYGAPAFLLADEVGVGKTMSAWGFALKTKKLKKNSHCHNKLSPSALAQHYFARRVARNTAYYHH